MLIRSGRIPGDANAIEKARHQSERNLPRIWHTDKENFLAGRGAGRITPLLFAHYPCFLDGPLYGVLGVPAQVVV